ncbi:MAG: TraR/DksA C4-type zinc finger protein [Gaiellales bacterium]|nr:TraR/DksA C4-type zinc finger protein [Gaiellales bacterium]
MDTATAQTALDAERSRLLRDLAHLRGELVDPGRDSAERLGAGSDDAVEAIGNELDEGMEQDLQASLDEVDAALQRLVAGTYGTCVDCGQPIPDQRLTALPASARCIECQSTAERR